MDEAVPTLVEARAAFLATLAGKSPHTTHTYQTGLDRFVEYLGERKIAPTTSTGDLPNDVLERFYTWLVGQYGRASRPTCLTYVASARAFFRFLERRGWGPRTAHFEQLQASLREVIGRGSYKAPRIDPSLPLLVLAADETELPPSAPENAGRRLELLRDRAILRTLFCTGMRRAEVASLNRSDVADGRNDHAIVTGKGDKERTVFFDQPTLAALRAYLSERADNYEPLFIRHDRARGTPSHRGQNYRITTQTVFDTVKRYARQVGVDVSPHDFRHEKATVMLNNGASLSEIQDLLGHASPDTTKRIYAHYEVSRLRQAFDRYSASPEELAKSLHRVAPDEAPKTRARRGDPGT
jgi:site-specific recombinase XerD